MQVLAIHLEEQRIGRKHRDCWPDKRNHPTTDEHIAFLKTVPDGCGLVGMLRALRFGGILRVLCRIS